MRYLLLFMVLLAGCSRDSGESVPSGDWKADLGGFLLDHDEFYITIDSEAITTYHGSKPYGSYIRGNHSCLMNTRLPYRRDADQYQTIWPLTGSDHTLWELEEREGSLFAEVGTKLTRFAPGTIPGNICSNNPAGKWWLRVSGQTGNFLGNFGEAYMGLFYMDGNLAVSLRQTNQGCFEQVHIQQPNALWWVDGDHMAAHIDGMGRQYFKTYEGELCPD